MPSGWKFFILRSSFFIKKYYGKIPTKTTYRGADGLYGLFHRRLGDVLHVAGIVAAGYRYPADYGTGVG